MSLLCVSLMVGAMSPPLPTQPQGAAERLQDGLDTSPRPTGSNSSTRLLYLLSLTPQGTTASAPSSQHSYGRVSAPHPAPNLPCDIRLSPTKAARPHAGCSRRDSDPTWVQSPSAQPFHTALPHGAGQNGHAERGEHPVHPQQLGEEPTRPLRLLHTLKAGAGWMFPLARISQAPAEPACMAQPLSPCEGCFQASIPAAFGFT